MLKRENTWLESIHYWKNNTTITTIVLNFRDLAPCAGNREESLWFDLILLDDDQELKRIGGVAPFDCKSAAILEEELILLEKLTEIVSHLEKFKDFDFSELATYVASYVNLMNLTDGKVGQLAFPDNMSDGWEAVWYENGHYDFSTRWEIEEVEDELIEEVEEIIEEVEDEDDDLI